MKRGLSLYESKSRHITENADGSFQVPSQTSSTKIYEVRLIQTTWVCTCPDFEYREVEACKHIFAVQTMIAAKTYLRDEPKPKVFADDAIPCDRCGSIRTMKYGKYRGERQVFYCKDCKHKFKQPLLVKARFTPETITLCLDLYFSGLSLRKIARNLSDHFGVTIYYSTIYRWIEKYVPVISDYVNSLSPQLSQTWHADELFLRMKGSPHQGRYAGLAFMWNVMDRETRFLLASRVSEGRDIAGAVKAFQEAIKNAHGQTPETLHSDAHKSYAVGIRPAFDGSGKTPEHVANCGVKKRHANNNRIERLNGTVRERVKVQRGWKSYQTPLAEGQRIQYNFVRPHMALEGKTPAQAAGIEVRSGWNELFKQAVVVVGSSGVGNNGNKEPSPPAAAAAAEVKGKTYQKL
jgi:transposase-like protein